MLSRLPVVTRALLIANIAIFAIQLGFDGALLPLRLWPWLPEWAQGSGANGFMPWQLVTHAFLHSDPVHLIFNMLGLVMFGAPLEHLWGERRFGVFYAVCLLGGGLCQLGMSTAMAYHDYGIVSALGASGAIYGLLLAYALQYPNHRIGLLFLPVMMKARTLVLILIALQVALALFGTNTGEAHLAHLGGAFFGWLLLLWWRRPRSGPPPPARRNGRERPNHLRAVR